MEIHALIYIYIYWQSDLIDFHLCCFYIVIIESDPENETEKDDNFSELPEPISEVSSFNKFY